MNWTNIIPDVYQTFPPEGYNVLISDGKHYDVAYYADEEKIWLKVDIEEDDAKEFTAFKPTKWCQIIKENSFPRELTRNEILERSDNYLTVGQLKEFLYKNSLPANAPVMIQRIKDMYYERHNWGVYLKKGLNTTQCEEWNRKIASGEYLDKEEYPNMEEEFLIPLTEEEIKQSMEQYTPAFSCVGYRDDKDMLFIDLHY